MAGSAPFTSAGIVARRRGDPQLGGALDDVIVGGDEAVGADHEAAAAGLGAELAIVVARAGLAAAGTEEELERGPASRHAAGVRRVSAYSMVWASIETTAGRTFSARSANEGINAAARDRGRGDLAGTERGSGARPARPAPVVSGRGHRRAPFRRSRRRGAAGVRDLRPGSWKTSIEEFSYGMRYVCLPTTEEQSPCPRIGTPDVRLTSAPQIPMLSVTCHPGWTALSCRLTACLTVVRWADQPTFFVVRQALDGMAGKGIDPELGAELARSLRSGLRATAGRIQAGTLRLILDREGGVRLEDCETVSKLASALLDVRHSGRAGTRSR